MWGKQWDAKCLLRTWSQGWRPGAPVPNLPRLGCRQSLSHPNQWKLLGHNVDKAPGRGLLRSEGGQVSPCTLPQGAHLPKPAGWEQRGRGQKQRVATRTIAPESYSRCSASRAGFPKGRRILNFLPSKFLRNLLARQSSLPWSHSSGANPRSKNRCDSTSNEPPIPAFDSRLSILRSLLHIQKMPDYLGNTSR